MSEKNAISNQNHKLDKNSKNEEKNFLQLTEVTKKIILTDAAQAVETSRRLLKILGIWQNNDPGKFHWRHVVQNILVFICYFNCGITTVPVGLFIAMKMEDPIGKIKLIGPWSFCIASTLKYCFLRSHRWDVEKCMKHVNEDWVKIESSTSRDIMLSYARFGRLVTMLCAVFTYSGGIFFSTLPFALSNLADHANNENITLPRVLSMPSYYVFFVETETPAYEIMYFIQTVASLMMHSITIAIYSLAVVVVMHACGQLKIVMGMLNDLVDKNGGNMIYDSVDSKLSDIIKHHVRALKLITSAEKMLREICLVELGNYTLNLCLLGYFILLEWTSEDKDTIALITWLILFFSFMFNIFSFCYIGELLTSEWKKVGETTYMIDWYRLPGKRSLSLGLIITMAHNPVTLTAGGAIQFSFACFTSVVKTAMGCLNILRTIMV